MYTYTHSRKWRYIKPARCCSVFFQIKFTKIVPLLLRKWAASRFNRISHTNQKMLRTPDYLHIQKGRFTTLKFCQHKTSKSLATVKSSWSRTLSSISQFVLSTEGFLFYRVYRICVSHIDFRKRRKRGMRYLYMLLWWVVGVSGWGMSGGYSKWDTLQFKLSLSSRDTHPFLSTHRLPTASHTYTLPSLHKEWKSVPQLLATVE